MKGFIEVHDLCGEPYILNIKKIESICTENGETKIYPMDDSTVCYYKVKESYEEIKRKIEEATR